MSNNKQQTAVEIAFEKLANQGLLVTKDYKNLVAYKQAKEMEKEQIEDAYEAGQDNVDYTASFVDEDGLENYYNETYGGGNQ